MTRIIFLVIKQNNYQFGKLWKPMNTLKPAERRNDIK